MTSIGTLLYTWLKGQKVGADEFGNRYYRASKNHSDGRERRWVLYNGRVEASKVPPEWHAWLHHTTEHPLSEAAAQPHDWQRSHRPNLTGTKNAYRPQADAGNRAWSPNE